jgi:2-polyprenyl-3-methyl-5-hydroxy-6-metoxy-1,4-benzoquinol methylase
MNSRESNSLCPLCEGSNCQAYYQDSKRHYYQCGRCALVFVGAEYHLTPEQEKAEYDLHNNSPHDPGYRRFLSRLCVPLCERLSPAQRGLDFGCGPGPALSLLLEEAGHSVALYDPFYQPDQGVLSARYDFVTATEVVEHLFRPGQELEKLWNMLDTGGYLALMTKLVLNAEAFSAWHYKNDPTHVCFFSTATWQWWAREHNASLEILGSDVILLQRL